MVLVGLAGVGGEELAASDHLVDHRRHMVVVRAGTEEAAPRGKWTVAVQQAGDVAPQVLLGDQCRRQVQRSVQPERVRHVGVELLHRGGPHRGEHCGPRIRSGVRDVGVHVRGTHRRHLSCDVLHIVCCMQNPATWSFLGQGPPARSERPGRGTARPSTRTRAQRARPAAP